MAQSHLPGNTTDREQCDRTAESFIVDPKSPPEVVLLEELLVRVQRRAWRGRRASYQGLVGVWQAAGIQVDVCDGRFDKALRRVYNGYLDEDGKRDPAMFRQMLGGVSPGKVVNMAPAEEVRRAKDLLAALAARPDLKPNADDVAELEAATAELEAALDEREAARRAKEAEGALLESDNQAFDTGWSDFIRAARRVIGEEGVRAAFPLFTRSGA